MKQSFEAIGTDRRCLRIRDPLSLNHYPRGLDRVALNITLDADHAIAPGPPTFPQMPHTTRHRKLQYESKKLVNVPVSDGWSTVSRKSPSSAYRNPRFNSANHASTDASGHYDQSNRTDHHNRTVLKGRPSSLLEHLTHDQAAALSLDPNVPHTFQPYIKEPDYTQERVASDFSSRLDTYRRSKDAEAVRYVLESLYGRKKLLGINKAIIVGSGSLSVADLQRGPLWQVAAFVYMCEAIAEIKGAKHPEVSNWQKLSKATNPLSLLQTSGAQHEANGEVLQIYAQEPVYNSFDKAFLKYMGIKIVETPEAFDMIDEQTMVFAPHFGVNAWPVPMRRGEAGLTIGNNVESSLDSVAPRQEIIEYFREWLGEFAEVKKEDKIPDVNIRHHLEDFLKQHVMIKWPNTEERYHSAFNNLAFYWKETEAG